MNVKKFISLTLLLAWMGLIFYLSNQSASDSSSLSDGLLGKIALFLNVQDVDLFVEKFGTFIRKCAHFFEYFVLGVLAYFFSKSYSFKNHIVISIIICVIYAASDEVHQLFVENRYASASDVLLDSLGSLCAVVLFRFVDKKCCQEKKH